MAPDVSRNFISLNTCVGLQEEEPQTAYPMSVTWASPVLLMCRWNWAHVTIYPVEKSCNQLYLLARYSLRAAIVVHVSHQYVSTWHWSNRVHTTIRTVKKLSTCRYQNSENKIFIMTIVYRMGTFLERLQLCRFLTSMCSHGSDGLQHTLPSE